MKNLVPSPGSLISSGLLSFAVAVLGMLSVQQARATNILIVAADGSPPSSELSGLGFTVTTFNAISGTPTLSYLSGFDAVVAYTNSTPANPTGLGNTLAQYVNAGGKLVLGTYGISSPWAIGGQIQTTGYDPLVNLGTNGNVSGALVATNPSDAIFSGVNLGSISYFHNSNFAYAGLDTGATLLATDGAGHNMIALNAAGNVFSNDLFFSNSFTNSAGVYQILANELNSFGPRSSSVPDGGTTAALLGGAMVGLVALRRRLAGRRA
jgi:hypothetical protein